MENPNLFVDKCFPTGDFFYPTKNYKFVRWQLSNPEKIKHNFDGSLQNNSVAGGYILRD